MSQQNQASFLLQAIGENYIMKTYTITVNGKAYAVTVEEGAAAGAAPAAAPVAPADRLI